MTDSDPHRFARDMIDAFPENEVVEAPFDIDGLVVLRNTVAAHASQFGLPYERIQDLVLVVHELATNAVRHGGGRGEMRLWQDDTGDIVCRISDAGTVGNKLHAQGFGPPAPHVAGGRGLWLVRQFADEVDIQSGPDGTHVMITVRSPKVQPESEPHSVPST